MSLFIEAYRAIRTPYFYDFNTTDARSDKSNVAKTMAGYRDARGNFDIPYDISAESIISDLDGCFYDDWSEELRPLGELLQCAMLTSYNHRLR